MRQFCIPAVAVMLLAAQSLAVKTEYWTHTSADDFKKGTAQQVVVTNHGELRLSRKLTPLLPADQHFDAITGFAERADGAVVFATFPDNRVLSVKDQKVETLAKLDNKTITALAIDRDGSVLVAATGERGELLRLGAPGEAPKTVFAQDGVDYVWAIVRRGENLVLATGPDASVFEISPNENAKRIAKLDGDNVLSLAVAPDGMIYAGTDTDGFVYRLDASNKPFLLFDAAEAEISALALDAQGNLLVSTGAVRQPTPEVAKPSIGRPEIHGTDSTIPAKPPAAPKQPDEPGGNAIPAEAPASPEHVETLATEPATQPDAAGPTQPAQTPDGQTETTGNALYRIDPKGFATEIFRASVVIHAMAVQNDAILLATGDIGEIYEVRPAAEETSVVVRTESAQETGILKSKSGDLILATSNSGTLATLSGTHAVDGTFESEVLDASVVASFGNMRLRGQLPDGTALSVSSRSGNSADPDKGAWSAWTSPEPAREFLPITAPAARYLQYRVSLKTSDGKTSPAVDEIVIAYQKPNVAPRVASVTVTPDPAVAGARSVNWEASDPNGDTLKYSVYIRTVGRGGWMLLAKDLAASPYAWAGKDAPDGRYEVKVVATDASDNQPGDGHDASRVSDPVIVDNTPPVIGDAKTAISGTEATVTVRVVDRVSTVASVEYAVDSTEHWQKRLPDDTMADSPEEKYSIVLPGLARGQHTLTIRATDQNGNASFETIGVNVP